MRMELPEILNRNEQCVFEVCKKVLCEIVMGIEEEGEGVGRRQS
jgi:hypothetical protein